MLAGGAVVEVVGEVVVVSGAGTTWAHAPAGASHSPPITRAPSRALNQPSQKYPLLSGPS